MKKFTLFFLMTVMLCLTQTVRADFIDETVYIYHEAKVGEIIPDPVPGKIFYLIQEETPETATHSSKYAGRYKNTEIKLYSLENIYCLNSGPATILAYAYEGDKNIEYEISIDINANKTAIGWHGGDGPDAEAAQKTLKLHPGYGDTYPLPTFFICTEAQMVDKELVCSWEEIPVPWYKYESTNTNVAFINDDGTYGESIGTNAPGETKITISLNENSFEAKNGRWVTHGALEYSFTVKSKMNMEIALNTYPNKEKTLLVEDGETIWSYHGICDHLGVHPEGYADDVQASPSEFGEELTVRLTKESMTDVIELSTDEDANGKMYCFMARDYGEAFVEIIMPETDEYYGACDTLKFNVQPDGFDLIYEEKLLGYEDEFMNIIDELNLREGDTVQLPHLMNFDTWERFNPHYLQVKMNGKVAMPMEKLEDGTLRTMDSLYAVAAGEDVVTYTYYRSPHCTPTVTALPVHIAPLLDPLTEISLAVDPNEDGNIVLNAYYNGEAQAVEIDDALTDEAVEAAMEENACGTDKWKEALPNSMSFNLPAGKVTITIDCWTELGYELRVKVRDQEVKAIPSQTSGVQTHTFTYDLETPAAVVFYLVEVPSNPSAEELAPARRLAKNDPITNSIALIKDITIGRQDVPTAIESIESGAKHNDAAKVLENGQLIIIKNSIRYNAQGQIVK